MAKISNDEIKNEIREDKTVKSTSQKKIDNLEVKRDAISWLNLLWLLIPIGIVFLIYRNRYKYLLFFKYISNIFNTRK